MCLSVLANTPFRRKVKFYFHKTQHWKKNTPLHSFGTKPVRDYRDGKQWQQIPPNAQNIHELGDNILPFQKGLVLTPKLKQVNINAALVCVLGSIQMFSSLPEIIHPLANGPQSSTHLVDTVVCGRADVQRWFENHLMLHFFYIQAFCRCLTFSINKWHENPGLLNHSFLAATLKWGKLSEPFKNPLRI